MNTIHAETVFQSVSNISGRSLFLLNECTSLISKNCDMQQKSEIETLMPNVKLADFANFFYTFQGVNHPDYLL